MRRILHLALGIAVTAALIGCEDVNRPVNAPGTPTTTTARRPVDPNPRETVKDNTPGALDQSEKESDRKITQEIRRAITSDDTMSVAARNVTIVTIDGVVTLKGSVKSADEKASIVEKAKAVSGVTRADDHLEVKP